MKYNKSRKRCDKYARELINLIDNMISLNTKTNNIEFKKAKNGVPENLYDTFSSISNTSGGIIIFGVDEKNNYDICGIANPDILQKKITEQSLMMELKFECVRGTFKVTLYNLKKTDILNDDFVLKLKSFCKTPRTKESIAKFFTYNEKHPSYFINTFVIPLIEQGVLAYTIPNKPKSKNQRIYTVE